MKKFLIIAILMATGLTFAQDEKGSFFGGFESNSQWLLDDNGLSFVAPEDQFRANNYLQLNYNYGKFTAGIQYESYLPSALLGFSPDFDANNGVANYFLNFKNETLDITGGYFYEQFGNGLILRSWEDRQLGINTAIRGVRIKFDPLQDLSLTALFGQQRNGFEVSDGTISGLDANFDIGSAAELGSVDLRIGASYVSRYQDRGTNEEIPSTVAAYGGRLDWGVGNFYGGFEGIVKDSDVIANEGVLVSNRLYDGTALQVNLGYSQKGFGINSTFRRLENFSFYADRLAEGNQFNQQLINFVPALTKQQDYLLTNIYVYNSQPRLLTDALEQRAGEVGTQTDIYFTFPKESFFGKYSTKVAANFSYWGGLETTFYDDFSYDVEFIGKGNNYFRDINFEIKNRWSSSFSSVLTYQNVMADKGVVLGGPLGGPNDIEANVVVAEGTVKFEGSKSLRVAGQHLWTQQDRKNWAGGVAEYNFNSHFSLYVADAWNYGGEGELHYYNFGGSYTKGRTRLGMNYGRQRGGLICVGGVCRFVPENNGFSANLSVNF
ncbi:hypothetical protein KXJ69_00955 [Aureisphaera sp. CAU 1614]|uniref:DUF5723 domain-containing protein n=1 Tax=Halomarinibacterium sedimenti TaxID=2857106 RepID=A0A9X1FLV8_9FLAO|nr:DUF6029 family protein [Halomarinibacterium sedimenti]MBW2936653.1 hypothetical protein [Halomarinibacterium sedimenti]